MRLYRVVYWTPLPPQGAPTRISNEDEEWFEADGHAVLEGTLVLYRWVDGVREEVAKFSSECWSVLSIEESEPAR